MHWIVDAPQGAAVEEEKATMRLATYYELHKRIEEAKTADEVRAVAREYARQVVTGPRYIEDDAKFMSAFVYALCRCNGTHWTQEIID
jgi:hypothetical protein